MDTFFTHGNFFPDIGDGLFHQPETTGTRDMRVFLKIAFGHEQPLFYKGLRVALK